MKNVSINRGNVVGLVLKVLSAFFGAVFSTALVNYVYYRPQIDRLDRSLEAKRDQIEIMRQSLERKANIIMTVIPFCVYELYGEENGTVTRKKKPLTLSRTKNFTFTIYVSNVGNAFAHVLYYSIFLSCDIMPRYLEMSVFNTNMIVLGPHESTSFEYVFNPLCMATDILLGTHSLNFTFGLGCAETSAYEIVYAQFEE
jgi:hypothetical protein